MTLAVVGGNEELAKAVSSKDTNMYIYHGWSDSTVIERRQQQLGRMADFLPPVTFSVFDL